MSKQKTKSKYPVPVESPEMVARRERLLAALEKQAKVATGTAQPVLRKMYDLIANTKVGSPFSMNLYLDVKNAFVRFMKDPVLPPPPIIMECVEFMQERLVSVGFTGQMEWPEGAPPLPESYTKINFADGVPGLPAIPAAPAAKTAKAAAAPAPAAKKPRPAQDGFESAAPRRAPMSLPPSEPTESVTPKSEHKQLDSFKSWIQNPELGKTKG
jgi:hypothetical protein